MNKENGKIKIKSGQSYRSFQKFGTRSRESFINDALGDNNLVNAPSNEPENLITKLLLEKMKVPIENYLLSRDSIIFWFVDSLT